MTCVYEHDDENINTVSVSAKCCKSTLYNNFIELTRHQKKKKISVANEHSW